MAGAGFKTFNTGDVLTASDVNTYLMQQTVMVFADASARTTALGANVAEGMISYLKDTNAVEVYNGSAWVSSDDPNAIQNTIVDAKGDIISATAADTPARLAVGNNGETLVADSSASTGLRWQNNFSAGKNKIINGDFGIWQRGTSFSLGTGTTYLCDRWRAYRDGSGATLTASQQTFTAGTAPVAGYEGTFFLRFNQTVAGTGGTYNVFTQPIEDVRQFAGQTVTLSFWAKADASRSLGTNLVQNFGTGGSASTFTAGTTASLTTSWQRFTTTMSVPSISGKTIGTNSLLDLRLDMPVNTTFTIDIWGVQVEAGSVATAFQTATGTIQGELAACQRYYWRSTSGAAYAGFGSGFCSSTTEARMAITAPVPMRFIPTSIDYSTINLIDSSYAGGGTPVPVISESSNFPISIYISGATGLTANRPAYLRAGNSTTAFIGFSAEL